MADTLPNRAPTLAEIVMQRWSMSVFCKHCRSTRVLDALDLALRRDEHKPIDAFKFRCGTCGRVGQVKVEGPGNMLAGRPQLWPPA